MSENDLSDAVSAMFENPQERLKRFEKNVSDLPPKMRFDDETSIPLIPRFFWLDARQSFVFGQFVATVLLAGMSIEISVRQFLESWIERRIENQTASEIISTILEEVDFRKAVKICEDQKCFGDDSVYGKLNACYDVRNKYSHARLSSILGKWGLQPVTEQSQSGPSTTHTVREDEFLTSAVMAQISSREDALHMLRLVDDSLRVIFTKSGYYSGKVGEK